MSEKIYQLTRFSHGAGCGCKVAPQVLQQMLKGRSNTHHKDKALLVGNENNDDAAAYDLGNGSALIATTDFFTPIVDDAFDFGRIAAANAISDVYAMGGRPLLALAILGWPVEQLPPELAAQVTEGGRTICTEAGITLAGGHTIDSKEPLFGLAVNGLVTISNIKRNSGAAEGDLLLLTKPIGTGIFSTAKKRGLLQDEHYPALLSQLTRLNKTGEALGSLKTVSAMTDVTGFGLLGHLIEMAAGSKLTAELYYNKVPKMKNLDIYLKQNTIPDATYRNWNAYQHQVEFTEEVNVMEAFSVLPDPQTNGGLLIAVKPDGLSEVQDHLAANGLGDHGEPVGCFTSLQGKQIVVKNI